MKYLIWIFTILFFVNFTACKQEQKADIKEGTANNEDLIQRGKLITQTTFQALSKELQKSMQEGGIEKAISYCNVNALPLTEKLSSQQNAIIKRTSTKYRNPKNAPTQRERDKLLAFQAQLEAGEEMKPILEKGNNQDMFYAPIITQELCLKCHGPKEGIAKYDKILSKYPEDLATGYKGGDLRGMWSVTLLPTKK